jgi:hypothetical protein
MYIRDFVAFVLIFCLSAPIQTFAQVSEQQPDRQWTAVTLLPMGEKLEICLTDGSKATGILTGSSVSGLTLRTDTGGRSLERPNVLKLYRSRGGSKLKALGIGAGVGAGAGTIVGVVSTDSGWLRGPAIALTTVIGGIVGSLVGLAIGRSKNKQLVYDSVVP